MAERVALLTLGLADVRPPLLVGTGNWTLIATNDPSQHRATTAA
jgi:hypothetical protein